jgi:hypothetical protein
MKINKFNKFNKPQNKLNENDLSDDLQYDLDDHIKLADDWMVNNYRKLNEASQCLDDLYTILQDYNDWLNDNKDEIGEDEIDVTLGNMGSLDILNGYSAEEISTISEKLDRLAG